MSMKINSIEITANIQVRSKGTFHENFLANASITFEIEGGGHFTISGFGIWKSKYDPTEINITPPGTRTYKYALFENSVWEKFKKMIVAEYDRSDIPIISVTNSNALKVPTKSNTISKSTS